MLKNTATKLLLAALCCFWGLSLHAQTISNSNSTIGLFIRNGFGQSFTATQTTTIEKVSFLIADAYPAGTEFTFMLFNSPSDMTANIATANPAYTQTVEKVRNGRLCVALDTPFPVTAGSEYSFLVLVPSPGAVLYDQNSSYSSGSGFIVQTSGNIDATVDLGVFGIWEGTNSLPTVDLVSDTTHCGTYAMDVDSFSTGLSRYAWNNGSLNNTNSSFTLNNSGTHTLIGLDADNCPVYDTMTVTILQAPTVNITASQTSACPGESVTLTASGASSYAWDNNVTNAVPFAIQTGGSYSVTGTAANGCTGTRSVNINVTTDPGVTINNSPQTLCTSDNLVTISGTPAGIVSGTGSIGSNFSPSLAGTGTHTIVYTVIDISGCVFADSIDFVVLPEPTVGINASTQAICAGESVTLSGTGTTNYSWNNSVVNAQAFTPASTATYTVTGTDASGCQKTASVQVVVNDNPNVSITASANAICPGEQVTLAGAGASSYQWDNNVTNNQAFIPSSTATYQVTGTDANGCEASAQVSVTVNPLPAVDAGADQTICGPLAQATVQASGAQQYTWTAAVVDGQAFTPGSSASYMVTGTDANGCQNTDSLFITVLTNGNLIDSVQTVAVSCFGEANGSLEAFALSSAATPLSYNWSTGATTQLLNGLQAGSYELTLTDANGCIEELSLSVSEPSVLDAEETLLMVSCNGEENGSISLSVTGGTPSYNYNWSTGETSAALTNLGPGTYMLSISDANGCVFTDSFSISEPALLEATSSSNDASCSTCADGSIEVVPTGGTAPYTFTWSNGESSNPLNNLADGVYTLTLSDANACVLVLSDTVSSPVYIQELSEKEQFKIYPNPSSGMLFLELPSAQGQTLHIFNALGQLLVQQLLTEQKTSLNLSQLPSGIYTILVEGMQAKQFIIRE